MASVTGVMISVETYSPLGLAAVPLVLIIALDLGSPLATGKKIDVRPTRRIQHKVLVNERILVELTVENRGEALERLTVRDIVPAGATVVRGSAAMICRLGREQKATLRYEIQLEQPVEVRFEATELRIQSLFGLIEMKLMLPTFAVVRAYPKLLSRRVTAGRARALSWTGSSSSRYKGGRVEFVDIRAYVPGDPLKGVNWKASARLGKKLVNEWTVERGLDCIVVVDLSLENLPEVDDWNGRGDVITCAYELANSLISAGNRVGMLILGSFLAKIKPAFGSRHLRVMLDQLVLAQPGSAWKMEHVNDFLETFFRTQYRNRGGTLVFVSPGVSTSLLDAQEELARSGFTCNSVVVNTLEKERGLIGMRKLATGESSQLGYRLARAELDWFENQLSRFSSVVEWRSDRGFVRLEEARVA